MPTIFATETRELEPIAMTAKVASRQYRARPFKDRATHGDTAIVAVIPMCDVIIDHVFITHNMLISLMIIT